MKRTPAEIVSAQRPSRWSRLIVASTVLALATSAWAQTNAVSTLAGSVGNPGYTNNTGALAQFRFTNPSGVAVDGAGNLYVADAVNNAIRKVTAAGVVTTFAGSPTGLSGNVDNATGTSALFTSPEGIAIDGAGNLYVADTGNQAIRMITSAGAVTTVAGTGGTGTAGTSGYVNNATGSSARFNTPLGITCDRNGTGGAAVNLYVADSGNNAVRKIVVSGGTTTTLSGSATGVPGATNGTLVNSLFSLPSGIVSNNAGTLLYVADTNNHLIRSLNITGDAVTTLAGSGSPGYGEGTGVAAVFNAPRGVTVAASGNILVSDTLNQVIRAVTTVGVSSLYAGVAGSPGSANGLALTSARFFIPSGITADTSSVYVIDTSNHLVRRIAAAVAPSITTQPASTVTVAAGNTAAFTVQIGTATNPPASFQWQRSTDSGGTWSNLSNGAITGGTISGATTNQLSIASTTSALTNSQFRVVVSNGVTPDATSTTSTLIVNQPPVITNATTTFNVAVSTAISAQITASGSPTPAFAITGGSFPSTWATFNVNTGVITGSPSDNTGSPFTFTVTATNSAGTSAPVSFTINVVSGPQIVLQPSNQTVPPGQNATFTVSATTTSGALTYQWQRQAVGVPGFFALSEGGQYTGTATASLTVSQVGLAQSGDQFRVVVSGVGTPATSNAATLTVTQSPTITSLSSATFVENQFGTFTVQATGSPTPVFTVTSGSLPAGVTLATGTSGVISGTPQPGTSATAQYFFQITASNGVSPDAQQTFTLTVSPTSIVPQFSLQPVSVSAALGQSVTYTVAVTGTPTPTIKWQRQPNGTFGFFDLINDATFSGVTTSTLTITNPNSSMNGDIFRAVASNTLGSAASNNVALNLVIGTSLSTYVGQPGQTGAIDATGTAARLNTPASVAVDPSGNVYVADASNHVIRKIASGGVVTTLAGLAGSSGSVDGTGSAARFNAPAGVAVNSIGTVYVADTFNHMIRKVRVL